MPWPWLCASQAPKYSGYSENQSTWEGCFARRCINLLGHFPSVRCVQGSTPKGVQYNTTFGIFGTVLPWFASYLEGREQSVKVDNVLSSPSPFQFGVPQGWALGPILFTLYSQPLSDLICRHECDYQKYADDTQLSKGAPPDQFQSLLCDIQTCTESLVGWMYSNKLKLNAEKTEVLPVASTSRLSSVGRDSVDIGGKRIPFRSSVRNLGVNLDQTLSMQQHISSVCRAAYLELRRIASIRLRVHT